MAHHAEVQVFALAEPDLKQTLDAYANLPTPSGWQLTYKAAVTPRAAVAHHTGIAQQHDVFELLETPPGKLASRNAAHDRAVDAGVDALVVGDADAPPLSSDYFNQLLEPIASSNRVVATNARPVAPSTPIGAATNAVAWLQDAIVPHLNGQGHAISADGWRAAGPFDEATEADRDVATVRLEEEFNFRRRLEAAGDVVDVPGAQVFNDTRRTRCRLRRSFRGLGIPEPDYCKRIGVEAFGPLE